MKNRNWFWGLLFIASSAFVIASQIDSFGRIGVLSAIATVLLAALIIHSIISGNFIGVFVPAAFLYMIYQKPLGLYEISPWILILAAVLASIGFGILFRRRPKNSFSHHGQISCRRTGETIDDNNPYAKVSFGSSSKYLHADCLKSGQFIVSFGELEVYFDKVSLSPEGAEVFLDCSFGELRLYVPRHWRIIDNLHVSLANFSNDTHFNNPAEDAPQLTLSGNVQFGDINVQYI